MLGVDDLATLTCVQLVKLSLSGVPDRITLFIVSIWKFLSLFWNRFLTVFLFDFSVGSMGISPKDTTMGAKGESPPLDAATKQ